MEETWHKGRTSEGTFCYDYTGRKVPRLEKKPVQVGKCTPGSASSSTSLTFAALPTFFRADRKRVDSSAIRHGYDDYSGLTVRRDPAGCFDLEILSEQDILWARHGFHRNIRSEPEFR